MENYKREIIHLLVPRHPNEESETTGSYSMLQATGWWWARNSLYSSHNDRVAGHKQAPEPFGPGACRTFVSQ